ncbi:MAG: glucose-6-phosphate isomerase [Spirochaetales bacterium]|nr:glucose-6-phosphate isomerase [Spirochaetales bacterium]
MEKLRYLNLDKTDAFKKLRDSRGPAHLKDLLNPQRVESYSVPAGAGLTFNYAARPIDDGVLASLAELSAEQQLAGKYRALVSGAVMNTGENRMVLHHLVRGRLGADVTADGKNLRDFYEGERKRVSEFAAKVHDGAVKGSTGKKLDTVVQIGIGGSDLGPRALYLALKNYARAGGMEKMRARFISNVDPDDARAVLSSIDLERTLFILVSKSGTTQETLTNRDFVIQAMKEAGIPGLDPGRHVVAVTSETSPLAKSGDSLDAFYIDDNIGGRYSATSPVGGVVLSLAFGGGQFEEILQGAHEADRLALESDPRKNPSMMDALIGVYERNVLGIPCSAILPYSQALERFPAHLQQLDMESNGKRVNRFGEPLGYPSGPVIFGEPGTNGQHSFYQLLHQGTDTVTLQFIGFRSPQDPADLLTDGSTSQTKLNANLAAQIAAFALGKHDDAGNKDFPGNRPSSLIYGGKLTPRTLGALLAHFENKVMFQGFLWNLNSFDQEGVQLGKVLTKQVLSGEKIDPVLGKYAGFLGISR